MKDNIKERKMQVLEYIKEAIAKTGYPPAIRDICAALNIKSTSTVQNDIEALVLEGYIVKDPLKKRALKVVGFDPTPVDTESNVVSIPIVGRVAAGRPILAEENIEDTFPVPGRFVAGENFMLKVKGESMIEAGIMDGDLVLVQKANDANNGEIVVALINDMEAEATVKTFYKESDHIRLQPQNQAMAPIIVKDCQIVGKVKGVFRYYN